MMPKRVLILAACLGGLVSLGGCHNPFNTSEFRVDYYDSEKASRGLVVVLTGIEGSSMFNKSIVEGLEAGGVDYAIRRVDWTSSIPLSYLYNQRAQSSNRRKARDLANVVMRYQAENPGRPVFLVGQSGGAAMAAWTAEEMEMGLKIDGVIMLAASLSPDYVLTDALMNSRQGIVNFYSERDVVMLGAGTTVTGTMDGEHSSSAGRVGFRLPGIECRPYYTHLYQVPFNPKMQGGTYGLHLTSGSARFVANYVAPLIRARQWDEQFVQNIAAGKNPG